MKTFNVTLYPRSKKRTQLSLTVQPGQSLAQALTDAGHGDVMLRHIKFREIDTDRIVLLVDGQECTLSEFLFTNTQQENVDHISNDDAYHVATLKVGQALQLTIHSPEIKRIK